MNWHLDPDTALIGLLLIAAAAVLTFLTSLGQSNDSSADHDKSRAPQRTGA